MPILDGKFIEDASIDLGKLKDTVVKRIDFDNAIASISGDSSSGLSNLRNELEDQIKRGDWAGLDIDGAASGAGTFGGASSPVTVTMSRSMRTTDYAVMVIPMVLSNTSDANAVSELGSIGTIGYKVIDAQHVKVYNTGKATSGVAFAIIAFRSSYIA